jgi:hypothetical protein
MSAQLAGHGVPTNSFSAHLALAAGVTVSIHAPSMHALRNVVAVLQPTEPANDAGNASTPNRVTVPAGSPATQTTAPSAQPAAVVGAGEAGNAHVAAPQGGSSAQTASTDKQSASPEVTFDVLKKAFLALSTKAAGREKCEAVLKPFGLAKLSAATPEQYAAVLAEIEKAGK